MIQTPNCTGSDSFEPIHRSCWGHFMHCLRHYADFSGRSTRAEFISFNVIVTLLTVLICIIPFALSGYQIGETVMQDEQMREESVACVRYYASLITDRDATYIDKVFPDIPLFRLQYNAEYDELQLYELGEDQEFVVEERGFILDKMANEVAYGHACTGLFIKLLESSGWKGFCMSLIVCLLYGIFVTIPSYAVIWRRLHDIGLSGALFFVCCIPFAGWIALLVMCLIDSKPGANIYGPPTKYP